MASPVASPARTARGLAGTTVRVADPARGGLLVVTRRRAETAGAPTALVAAVETGTDGARGTIVADRGRTGVAVVRAAGRVTVAVGGTIDVDPGRTGQVATSIVGLVTVAAGGTIARGTVAAGGTIARVTVAAGAMSAADPGRTAEAAARAVGLAKADGDGTIVADPVMVAAVGTSGQAVTTIASRSSSATGSAAERHACPRSRPAGQSPSSVRASRGTRSTAA
ncbi:MAG: hypothetical protein ACTHJJ_05385 [Intrasporangium sp.]|uniref:hypothetical protein n=1 Tax=Intrasporangium sp. TaxID=1925024 RepID=UPI003F8209DA